jgi:hypothetical protein
MSIWNLVIAIILIGHGLGHALIFWALAGRPLSQTHSAQSWLISRVLPATMSRLLAAVLFSLALVAFVGAGLAVLGWWVAPALWSSLALWAAMISLVGLTLFWNALPFFIPNKVGAIAVDVAVLVWLLASS